MKIMERLITIIMLKVFNLYLLLFSSLITPQYIKQNKTKVNGNKYSSESPMFNFSNMLQRRSIITPIDINRHNKYESL
jgi:hypothetical protein